MHMSEMIDVFDGNHKYVGQEERLSVHKKGMWHQTFHCWIVGERSTERFVVLQLRALKKKNYPNMLDITAAGHLEAGELPEDGIRELEEELGVKVTSKSLRYLGIKHDIADEPGGIQNREFAHVYLLRDDRTLAEYHLQEDEVSGLVSLPLSQGLRLFSGEIDSIQCDAIRVEGGQTVNFKRIVKVTDLIPRVDSYYLKVLIMAELFLNGASYLAI